MDLIKPDLKISDLMKLYPEITDYLLEKGLCGCGIDSSLNWSLERAAKHLGISVDSFIEEIKSKIKD
ncbi:MAG: hypothetical protein GXO99_04785 [Nitrospirae bacterium]|nr:hypothetical protein [Nitrospirota bacterium]